MEEKKNQLLEILRVGPGAAGAGANIGSKPRLGRLKARVLKTPSPPSTPLHPHPTPHQAEGITPEGDLTLLQYHPPFTYGEGCRRAGANEEMRGWPRRLMSPTP